MADLFVPHAGDCCRLLDAGAGSGSLSAAFLERWSAGGFDFRTVELDAFEIDASLHPSLEQAIAPYSRDRNLVANIRGSDFVNAASAWLSGNLFAEALPNYTHAILNPPYKKMRSNSEHRSALRRVGIETVNLYSAFVALSVALLDDGGQLVAIVPRSFCNGPYYRSFREFILQRAAIRRLHLFASRDRAFRDDGVLQETIIVHLERGKPQGSVTVSTSTDERFSDLAIHEYPCDRIVSAKDTERLIHVPTSPEISAIDLCPSIRCSLAEMGVKVSTGPVVDFRMKEYLRHMPEPDTVPLLYPIHFVGGGVSWPRADTKKPNAIQRHSNTEKWLLPNGFYCVVRRFSSKEEKRRIVASVVDPDVFEGVTALGFENHLNVFHDNKRGLPKLLAYGLAAFLNATAVDEQFRRFNGHTQVNATDLRLMKYPERQVLMLLGEWAIAQARFTQTELDEKLEALTVG